MQPYFTHQACRRARWPSPPAWAPAWPRASPPATGRTGRHRPGRGRAAGPEGCGDFGGSAVGRRTSRRATPGHQRGRVGHLIPHFTVAVPLR